MLARLRSRAQEEKGFTLIELLVVVLIIGILAAIAIPAFLGQKKGAQDSNAKSLLRNGAIAMESYYSENQDFDFTAMPTELAAIEPNITWQAGAAQAKLDQVQVTASASTGVATDPENRYILQTASASGNLFYYYRNEAAQTFKCKEVAGTATSGWTAPVAPAASTTAQCASNEW